MCKQWKKMSTILKSIYIPELYQVSVCICLLLCKLVSYIKGKLYVTAKLRLSLAGIEIG